MQDARLVPVNKVHIKRVWNVLDTHSTVGSCVQTLKHAVFAGGVFCGDSASHAVRRHMGDVAHRALEWVICVGVVPVTFKQVDGLCLPVIPTWSSLELFSLVDESGILEHHARFQRGVGALSMFMANSTETTEKVLLWNKTDYPPDAHGNLRTPMIRVTQSERFLQFMRQRAMVAEQLRTNPLIVSQSRSVKNGDTEGVTWNVADDVVVAAEEARLKTVEEIQHRHKAMHQSNSGIAEIYDEASEEALFVKGCEPVEYFVAAERDVSRTTQVMSPLSELRHLMALANTEIHKTLGIPEGMFNGSGASLTTSGNNLQAFAFNAHIMTLKQTIEHFLSDALGVAQAANKEVWESHAACNVQIPGLTFVPQEATLSLFDRGIITDVECRRILRSSIGLDPAMSGNESAKVVKVEKTKPEKPKDDTKKNDNQVDKKRERENERGDEQASKKSTSPPGTPNNNAKQNKKEKRQ